MSAPLRNLIEQLRAADSKRRVFGADSHNYRLRPTLSEATLRDFEIQHDLPLPADYRAFLSEVGDGEVGPFYGLETLQDAASGRDLSRPFPLIEASPMDEDDIDSIGDEEQPGVLEICHQGCSIYNYLVVRGPAYGTIWQGESELFYPMNLSFEAWFKHWAERALRILENEKWVRLIRKGMDKARVLELTGDFWREREWTYDGETRYYLESSEMPVQLELDENGRVIKINPSPFI